MLLSEPEQLHASERFMYVSFAYQSFEYGTWLNFLGFSVIKTSLWLNHYGLKRYIKIKLLCPGKIYLAWSGWKFSLDVENLDVLNKLEPELPLHVS